MCVGGGGGGGGGRSWSWLRLGSKTGPKTGHPHCQSINEDVFVYWGGGFKATAQDQRWDQRGCGSLTRGDMVGEGGLKVLLPGL